MIRNKAYLIILEGVLSFLLYGCVNRENQLGGELKQKQSSNAQTELQLRHTEPWESDPTDMGDYFRVDDAKPIIGSLNTRNGSSYHLSFDFGIEQWENNKKTTHRFQKWYLTCNYPGEGKVNRTWCSLERLIVDRGLGAAPMVDQQYHYLDDGTLKIVNADWEEGILNLTIIFNDKNTAEVAIRFSASRVTDGMSSLRLESFKAYSIARGMFKDGTMSAIEYRIPQYSYTLNIPLQMQGISSGGIKKWDEMFATLSDSDKTAWNQYSSDSGHKMFNDDRWNSLTEDKFKKKYPNLNLDRINDGQQKLTSEQEKELQTMMKQAVTELMEQYVANSPLSSKGKRIITAHLVKYTEQSWLQMK